MEDLKMYGELFDGWMTQLTADEGKQIKLKNHEMQKAFPEVRANFVEQSTRLKMLEFMTNSPMDQWSTILSSSSAEHDLQETKDKVTKAEMELDNLQEQLEDLISAAQINHDSIKTKMVELGGKLEQLEKKKAILEDLEAKHTEAVQRLEKRKIPRENFHQILQEQKEKLSQIGPLKAEVDSLIAGLNEDIERLQGECMAKENLIGELTRMVDKKRQARMKEDRIYNTTKDWLSNITAQMVNLTGCELLDSSDDSITLKLRSLVRSSVSAKLTLRFKAVGNYRMALSGAEIDIADMDISSIVTRAVERDDPPYLVHGISELLNTHAPLIQEVDELRSLYAVDYLHEDGILRLMVGSKGQIICTLKIEPGYPLTGSVRLTSLEGTQTPKNLSDFKPPVENPRLMDWVQYLQKETEAMSR